MVAKATNTIDFPSSCHYQTHTKFKFLLLSRRISVRLNSKSFFFVLFAFRLGTDVKYIRSLVVVIAPRCTHHTDGRTDVIYVFYMNECASICR